MRNILCLIFITLSTCGYSQASFADIIKAAKLATGSKKLDVEGLSNLKKAAVYSDQVIVNVTNNKLRPLATALCPNLMYDVTLTDLYYAEKKRIEVMQDLINGEPNLKKEDKKRFLKQVKTTAPDEYLAAGFFLIGQYAYLENKYETAAQAFKVSKDLFTLNKAEELTLARVEMAATLAELQVRGEIDLERFVFTNGELFADALGEKNLLNLIMYLQSSRGGNPCSGTIDADSSNALLIRVYNIYWQYGHIVLIRFKSPFRTPYQTNSLADILIQSKDLPTMATANTSSQPMSEEERKYAALKVRILKDPLMNALLFNNIMGANDLVDNYQQDEDLLRQYATLSDFILTKNDLNYQLATSTATLGELNYDPAQPEKLKSELQTAIQNLTKDNIAKSFLYRHLATLFYMQNQPDSAAHYIRKTYRIQKKILPNLSPEREKLVQGFFTYLEGDYPKAKALCEQALAAQTNDPTRSYTLHTLGLIHRAEQDTDAALSYFEQAVELIETQTRELNREYSKEFFIQMTYDAYENLVSLYRKKNRVEDAFNIVLKSRHNTYKQAVSRQALLANTDLTNYKNRYNKEIQKINEAGINESNDEEVLQILNGFYSILMQGEKEHNRLRLSANDSDKNTALTLSELRKQIEKDEALLHFGINENQLICRIVTNSKIEDIELCTEDQLRQDMEIFKKNFIINCQNKEGHISGKDFFKIMRPVYEHIWKGIDDSALIQDKKLVIAPASYLHGFPFEMLISDDGPKALKDYGYLIQKHTVRYFPESVMKAATNNYAKAFLGFGNPLFTKSQLEHEKQYDKNGYLRNQLTPLPFTQKEIDLIAAKFPDNQSNTYTGIDATEDALKRLSISGALADYRYIHFATHGIIDLKNYQLSAIALNHDKNLDEDGFVEFYEIDREQIRLEAELVVLSACETALGKEVQGMGIMGFGRAFSDAGAKSVILSKWKVFDGKTADFFDAFYTQLAQNPEQNKAEILAEIKRKFIQEEAYPYHWASFVYIGK